MRFSALSAAVALGLGIFALTAACGTDAVGVEACRDLETLRCEQAAGCGFDLGVPRHRDKRPIEGCVAHYRDACLHGLVSRVEPSSVQLKACMDAIRTGSCDVVKTPEKDPACAFLVPVETDAGAPAVADASAE